MMLGARTGAWAKSGGWVNPYLTDGLVAMWDVDSGLGAGDSIGGVEAFGLVSRDGWLLADNLSATATFSSRPSLIVIDAVVRVFSSTSTTSTSIIDAFDICQYFGEFRSWTTGFSTRIKSMYYAVNSRFSPFIDIVSRNTHHVLYQVSSDKEKIKINNELQVDMYVYYQRDRTENNNIVFGSNDSLVGFKSIRFYNRYLSAEEATSNYAIDKARFNLP